MKYEFMCKDLSSEERSSSAAQSRRQDESHQHLSGIFFLVSDLPHLRCVVASGKREDPQSLGQLHFRSKTYERVGSGQKLILLHTYKIPVRPGDITVAVMGLVGWRYERYYIPIGESGTLLTGLQSPILRSMKYDIMCKDLSSKERSSSAA